MKLRYLFLIAIVMPRLAAHTAAAAPHSLSHCQGYKDKVRDFDCPAKHEAPKSH